MAIGQANVFLPVPSAGSMELHGRGFVELGCPSFSKIPDIYCIMCVQTSCFFDEYLYKNVTKQIILLQCLVVPY